MRLEIGDCIRINDHLDKAFDQKEGWVEDIEIYPPRIKSKKSKDIFQSKVINLEKLKKVSIPPEIPVDYFIRVGVKGKGAEFARYPNNVAYFNVERVEPI